ncbi:MAG: helix-turn-helix transcriptional regulator [Synergistaceae bacterium]|nr:helix-turn-helix transcriptional regulator [Synergistaceae bacterium]
MLIGDRIRELRNRLNLSQTALGDMVDTDGSVISRWETNRARVSQRYIVKLANALGTSTDYLLGETDDPTLKNSVSNENMQANGTGEKRLIIKNRDMCIDLPETSESFEILRRFFDMQGTKKLEVAGNLAVAK